MGNAPVIQIVGYKNSGKTTTTCELISRFAKRGIKVGSIKHDAHDFEVDYPGKDTWRHREAGAHVVAISSNHKTAIMEQKGRNLEELIEALGDVELILVEGYKFADYPKVVLLRDIGDLSLVEQTSQILLIASWFPYSHPTIPVLSKDDVDGLFEMMNKYLMRNYWGDQQ